MAGRANDSFRDATDVADVSDEVDDGWDDIPAPVTAPPPSAGNVSPQVSEIRALSPNPSDINLPNFRRRQVNPALIVAGIGAAVALIVASVASPQFPSVAAPRNEARAPLPPEAPPAQPTIERQRPEPAAPPAPTTNEAFVANAAPAPSGVPVALAPSATSVGLAPSAVPAAASASAEQPEAASENAIAVTVKVFPENSVIFRAGEKLGYGMLQVSVARDTRQHLTALHDGYLPSNFTLDGSRDTVVVRLQRVPAPQPSATPVSDSPFSEGEAHQGEVLPPQGERRPEE